MWNLILGLAGPIINNIAKGIGKAKEQEKKAELLDDQEELDIQQMRVLLGYLKRDIIDGVEDVANQAGLPTHIRKQQVDAIEKAWNGFDWQMILTTVARLEHARKYRDV